MSLILVILGAASGGLLLILALIRLNYWFRQGRKLQESGYMPPPSSKVARFTFKVCCRVIQRIFVGPMTVYGRDNQFFQGRGLVLPNHVFIWDFAVVGAAIEFSYRQIAKAAEIKNFIIAMVAAWIGTVGVQVKDGKSQDGAGEAVVDAGAKILKASFGSRLLMFAQGKLIYLKERLHKGYRTGATRVLERAAEGIDGEPLYALPVGLHYITDPAHAGLLQRVAYALGLRFLRTQRWKELVVGADGNETWVKRKAVVYGVIVVIGEPIAQAELPADPRQAINGIADEIEVLIECAEEMLA